jgi:phage terminase large subunit
VPDAEAAERLTELLSECHDDPDLFNSAILGRPCYWSRQREIAESVCRYQVTVAYTGNAIGKDYLVGGIVPWWLCTRYESLVVVTGPSQTVLGSVTWKEIRRASEGNRDDPAASVPLGLKLSNGIKASPLTVTVRDDWRALGYSTTSVERASGQHNRKLLVVVEEASGVEDEIYDAIDSLKYSRLLLIGNPIRADGRFVQFIRQADRDRHDRIPPHRAVNAIRVSSRESPDADKEESKVGLADKTWIENNERRYGKHSLWIKSHVDAVIPEVSADALIPETWLDWAAAQKRLFLPQDHPIHATRRISCDLGEGVGRDSSAIIVRDDWGVLEVVWGAELGLAAAAQRIADLARRYNVSHDKITYDKVGIGRDFPLHLARHGLERAVGYAGSGSPGSTDFVDLRSEAAWKLRQRLDPGGATDHRLPHLSRQDFCIPPGPYWQRLREELKPLTYHLVGRKTGLLSKKDWATTLGHSPDLADALIQSFAF